MPTGAPSKGFDRGFSEQTHERLEVIRREMEGLTPAEWAEDQGA